MDRTELAVGAVAVPLVETPQVGRVGLVGGEPPVLELAFHHAASQDLPPPEPSDVGRDRGRHEALGVRDLWSLTDAEDAS